MDLRRVTKLCPHCGNFFLHQWEGDYWAHVAMCVIHTKRRKKLIGGGNQMNKVARFLNEWWGVACLAITLIYMLTLYACPQTASAEENPKEPSLWELHKWYPVQDGNVILEYRVANKHGVGVWRYKHAQKAPVNKIPQCNEVTVRGDELHLITQESKPSLYIIEKKTNGFSPEFTGDFTYEFRR